MRYFKPFGGFFQVKAHASKDGKKTLCGRDIDSSWEELEDWKMWFSCKKCFAKSLKVMERGKQLSKKEKQTK
ncbi:hypothetical protein CH330_01540 [candidate division WOR-3 bacterium JGI_Cruoil_03_51_56]|uniref:Uncharacterized protein n=1 Tax=candidate division WOR-3 bacterium JGI_Cruoil_03_51_56 TaxID=1973747 RepID=A0A235BXA7_UNCW3|nr:MAG: hypothetical protein CH330_01540 [candidate division WOR-3 bacterium JGI_Cruoil_03_51_56]